MIVAADIKNNKTSAVTHGVAKRSRAAVGQVVT